MIVDLTDDPVFDADQQPPLGTLERMVLDLQRQVKALTAQVAALSNHQRANPDIGSSIAEFREAIDYAKTLMLECSDNAVADRLTRYAMRNMDALQDSDAESVPLPPGSGHFPSDLRMESSPSSYAQAAAAPRQVAPHHQPLQPPVDARPRSKPAAVSTVFDIGRRTVAAKALLPYQPGQYQPIVRLYITCRQASYMEVRQRFREMGVQSGKILDMIFHRQSRTADILELMVRESDREVVSSTLRSLGFSIMRDIDPDDPRLLDPKQWGDKTEDERKAEAVRQFRARLERMIGMAKRPSVKGKLRNDLNLIRVANGEAPIPLSPVGATRAQPNASGAESADPGWTQVRRKRPRNRNRGSKSRPAHQQDEMTTDDRLVHDHEQKDLPPVLTSEFLDTLTPAERDDALGPRLYELVQVKQPQLAGRIVALFLHQYTNADLLPVLDSEAALSALIASVLGNAAPTRAPVEESTDCTTNGNPADDEPPAPDVSKVVAVGTDTPGSDAAPVSVDPVMTARTDNPVSHAVGAISECSDDDVDMTLLVRDQFDRPVDPADARPAKVQARVAPGAALSSPAPLQAAATPTPHRL
jgi:hypothetical protein